MCAWVCGSVSGYKNTSLNLLPPAVTDWRQCVECSLLLSCCWHSNSVVGFVASEVPGVESIWHYKENVLTKECISEIQAQSRACARIHVDVCRTNTHKGTMNHVYILGVRPFIHQCCVCVCAPDSLQSPNLTREWVNVIIFLPLTCSRTGDRSTRLRKDWMRGLETKLNKQERRTKKKKKKSVIVGKMLLRASKVHNNCRGRIL